MILIKNINKNFKEFKALKNISLNIKKGEIFGLLGPNGAGKSTLISVLITLIRPTSGNAIVAGFDIQKYPEKVRENIGIVFQDSVIDDDLTIIQNLDIAARLYCIDKKEREKRIIELLKLTDLTEFSRKKIKLLSGGMKRKVEIARGLINNPKVLFLDEPTLGLDPKIRVKIWNYIHELNKKRDITIVLATNYLEEAEKLCDRIGIMHKGEIVKIGNPNQLKRLLQKKKNKRISLYDVFLEHTK